MATKTKQQLKSSSATVSVQLSGCNGADQPNYATTDIVKVLMSHGANISNRLAIQTWGKAAELNEILNCLQREIS